MRDELKRAALTISVGVVIFAGLVLGANIAVEEDRDPRQVMPDPRPAQPLPRGDFHGWPGELRNTLPHGVNREKAKRLLERVEREVDAQPDPRPRPTGGAQNYSFRTAYSGTPRGTGGQRLQVVIHCTVSSNREGWGDVYGVKGYLDRVGLSATWIADFEAHFLKTMTGGHYAFTQGPGFNRYSLSLEIVSSCAETREQWLRSPLIRSGALASWLADRCREIGVPCRRVDPAGCTPQRGYTDHAALECGNDHTDISSRCRNGGNPPRDFGAPPCAFPWDVLARQVADGPDAPNRKLKKWERSHRIAHAKLRSSSCAAPCRARYRERSRKLHRLIARERRG